MGQPKVFSMCVRCRDDDGKHDVPATHRLQVQEVGTALPREVWGCKAHVAKAYAQIIATRRPLDAFVHNMETGQCLAKARLRWED